MFGALGYYEISMFGALGYYEISMFGALGYYEISRFGALGYLDLQHGSNVKKRDGGKGKGRKGREGKGREGKGRTRLGFLLGYKLREGSLKTLVFILSLLSLLLSIKNLNFQIVAW